MIRCKSKKYEQSKGTQIISSFPSPDILRMEKIFPRLQLAFS